MKELRSYLIVQTPLKINCPRFFLLLNMKFNIICLWCDRLDCENECSIVLFLNHPDQKPVSVSTALP